MVKFSKGERVIVVGDDCPNPEKFDGKTGVVIGEGLDQSSVQVKFDDSRLGAWNIPKIYLKKL